MRNSDEKPYSRIKWETIRKMYGPKMIQAMHGLHCTLKENYPTLNASEEWEMDCDSYSVVVRLEPEGREPVDVSFSIEESYNHEGIEGGYTFRVDVVEDSGRMIGDFSPFNYTEQVWCKSHPAIAERFAMFPLALANPETIQFIADSVLESEE